jgi:hypothetical protein
MNSTEILQGKLILVASRFNSSFPSWGLSYNLYADKLLRLNLFPASVYSMRKYTTSSSCRRILIVLPSAMGRNRLVQDSYT